MPCTSAVWRSASTSMTPSRPQTSRPGRAVPRPGPEQVGGLLGQPDRCAGRDAAYDARSRVTAAVVARPALPDRAHARSHVTPVVQVVARVSRPQCQVVSRVSRESCRAGRRRARRRRRRRSRGAPPGRAARPARLSLSTTAASRPREPTRPPWRRRPRARRPGARAARRWRRRRCGRRSRGPRHPPAPPVRARVARARVTSFWSSGASSVTDGLLRHGFAGTSSAASLGGRLDAARSARCRSCCGGRRSPRR